MIKKFLSISILFLLFVQTVFIDHSFAITAEERLEEVEKQLIAIANQIKQYEGDKTYLEKAQKNKELSENEFNNLSESNAKLKCIFHMLVPDDEELDENGINFTI